MRNMKQAQLAILTRCFGRKGLAWKILWYPIRNLLNRDFLRRSFREPDVFTLVPEFSLRRYLRLTRTRIVQNPSGKKRLTGKNTEQHRRDSSADDAVDFRYESLQDWHCIKGGCPTVALSCPIVAQ